MSPNPSVSSPSLHLALFQFAPALRDVAHNAARITAAAGSDLLVSPELSLTGYDLRDDATAIAVEGATAGASADGLFGTTGFEQTTPVLVGAVVRDGTSVPYNAALLVDHGIIRHVHRKVYLPTYGMFDEGRYFGRGQRVESFALNDWRIGVLICEDFWHPMLAYLLAMQGVQLLVVMAAAPGRGVWDGGEAGGFFASSDAWERIARAYAQLYGIYVVLCNRCGVEGGVTFAGESVAVAPDASVLARAGTGEEIINLELRSDAVRAARTPYAHIRDEDAALAIRELARVAAVR